MTDAIANTTPDEIDTLKKHAAIVAKSGLVPDHFQKHPASIYTAVGLAKSMGEDPIFVMQNIFFIGGKPGWSSAFLLARLRRTKTIRGTVRYDIEDTEEDGITVRAKCIDFETGDEIIGPAVTMRMAEDDGWAKKNPKYKSMPQIMLMNRALAFLTRYYYPDILAGLPMVEELRDTGGAAFIDAPVERTGALAAIEAQVTEVVENEADEGVDEKASGLQPDLDMPAFEDAPVQGA